VTSLGFSSWCCYLLSVIMHCCFAACSDFKLSCNWIVCLKLELTDVASVFLYFLGSSLWKLCIPARKCHKTCMWQGIQCIESMYQTSSKFFRESLSSSPMYTFSGGHHSTLLFWSLTNGWSQLTVSSVSNTWTLNFLTNQLHEYFFTIT